MTNIRATSGLALAISVTSLWSGTLRAGPASADEAAGAPTVPAVSGAPERPPGLARVVADGALRLYRKHVAPNSIDRCPFRVSCSSFAQQSIARRGTALGVLAFIDRHLYREHARAWSHYPLYTAAGGRLRLDDGFYLDEAVTAGPSVPAARHDTLTSQVPSNEPGQGAEAFAEWLMAEQDFDRAITAFKELLFHSGSKGEDPGPYLTSIGEAYRRSGHEQLALKYYARALKASPSTSVERSAGLGTALAYHQLRLPSMAIPWLDRLVPSDTSGRTGLVRAQMDAELGNWEESRMRYRELAARHRGTALAATATQLADAADRGGRLRTKNVTLATTLSLSIPGAGQFYSQHYYDGLLAFAYVGSLAGATYALHLYSRETGEDRGLFYAGVTITSLFHLANVWGARQTARYRNTRIRADHLEDMRAMAIPESIEATRD